jgi:hypothetical protein
MVVGLSVYKIKNKETYEKLKGMFYGYAFFRKTENDYFIKTPKNPTIEEYLKLGLIEFIK